MGYDLAEIGVHAKDSEEMEEKVNEYVSNYESDYREAFMLDKKAMVQREVK